MASNKQPRVLRSQRKIIGHFDVLNPLAAGIDAGAKEHFVSVPEHCSDEPVRSFGTCTPDLHALADWLVACGITTVAIEATGVYWIPLYEILEERGLNPKLVDSRSVGKRNKKTDVLDCQWLRQLHMFGLLDGAFRPTSDTLVLRSYNRHRRMLIEYAADHIRHIQKALELMNVKLNLVVSDIVGVTGLRIIRAILAGECDPAQLATLRDRSCKATEETFVNALIGNYREEHLFELKQALELYEIYQSKVAACDERIAQTLEHFAVPEGNSSAKRKRSRRKNQPHFDMRELLVHVAGVDLVKIDGLSESSVLTLTSETGTDMSHWPSGKHFTAWLHLAPNTQVTGGKPIRKKGKKIHPNRAAQAFRLAAQTLERSTKCALGAFFRRIKSRHGRQAAIKATARKLALIYYSMLKNKTEYQDLGVTYYEARYRENLLNSMKKKALMLGFELTPLVAVH